MTDWTSEELAYLAGFIDGEGSITVFNFRDRRSKSKHPGSILRLSIYNTDANVMGWIALRFGGRVGKVKRRTPMQKQQYIWEQSGRKAAIVLSACLPYFKVKRQQAEIFIEVAKTMRNWGKWNLPADVIEFRRRAAIQISALNKGERDAG